MPTLRGDLEFIKNEGKKALGFSRGYVSGYVADRKKTTIVKALEFGPFNGLRLLAVIAITLFFLVSFSLWKTEGSLWVVLIIFLIVYGLLFRNVEKENTEIAATIFGFFFGIIIAGVDIIKSIAVSIFEIGKDIVFDTALWLWQFTQEISMDILDLVKDLLMSAGEIIKDSTLEIWELAKSITTDGFTMIWEIITDILSGLWDMTKDIATGIGTGFIEVIKEMATAFGEMIKDIFSSFGAMITDMLTFSKKEGN